ncbi:hypothetical protein Tco_1053224, partial [Tanacetum coccineum]
GFPLLLLHSNDYLNDLEKEPSFVLTFTPAYCSVQSIRHIRETQYGVSVELGRLPNLLSCSTLLICPILISKVLTDAPWFLMAASVVAQISLIKWEFSSCLFADSFMNFLRVSSIDCLHSWYEGFALFL